MLFVEVQSLLQRSNLYSLKFKVNLLTSIDFLCL